MFDFLIALIFGAGFGGWLLIQLNRRSGLQNSGGNALSASFAAVIVFVIVFTLLKFVLHLS